MQPEEPQYQYPPQPESEPVREPQTPYEKSYIEGDNSFSNIINHLLKKPLSVIHTMDDKEDVRWMPILAMTVFALTLFGFIVGSFQGATEQMWLAPMKIVGGVLFSSLICLPSLYIFCCIGGLDKKFSTILGIQSCTMAITSLLLIGFSPVIWLFSSSSDSMSFFGFLCISIWLLCLFMGLKFLTKTGKAFGMSHTRHLYLWAAIFTLVTLQMPTTLRPIIGQSDKILELDEKKFFIQHWGDELDEQHVRNRAKTGRPQRGVDQ
jgi:hypothetical protein